MRGGALVWAGSTIEERDAVTTSIKAGNMLSVDAERDGRPYYRVAFRPAPNNEFAGGLALREAVNRAGGRDPVDVPSLAFLPPGTPAPAAGGLSRAAHADAREPPFPGGGGV